MSITGLTTVTPFIANGREVVAIDVWWDERRAPYVWRAKSREVGKKQLRATYADFTTPDVHADFPATAIAEALTTYAASALTELADVHRVLADVHRVLAGLTNPQ